MLKNLTTNQLILIALAAVLFMLAAFALFLLQDPQAPLPFSPALPTSTSTAPIPTQTNTSIPPTHTPVLRTSYTPFATKKTPLSTQSPGLTEQPTTSTGILGSTASPTGASPVTPSTIFPTATLRTTPSTTTPTAPSATVTMSPGEVQVTGRIVQNATPLVNVVVRFADDAAERQSTSNEAGHYSFTTLAPGTSFILTFRQADNPYLTPLTEITSLAWLDGTLPIGVNPIEFPDLEISLNLHGLLFELVSPVNGVTYSASVISSSNPIQFIWALYSLGGSYQIELGPSGSDQPVWTSNRIASNNFMWDGTLSDGTHITQGAYWWRVGVTKNLGNYVEVIFTQPFNLIFNP